MRTNVLLSLGLLCLVFVLVGCGGQPAAEQPETPTNEPETQPEIETAAPEVAEVAEGIEDLDSLEDELSFDDLEDLDAVLEDIENI